MNPITELRNIIASNIVSVDSMIKEDNIIFDNENEPALAVDRTYRLIFDTTAFTRMDTTFDVAIPFKIEIMVITGPTERRNDFDDIYCKAIEIGLLLSRFQSLDSQLILGIDVTSVIPTPGSSNDEAIKMTIECTATAAIAVA